MNENEKGAYFASRGKKSETMSWLTELFAKDQIASTFSWIGLGLSLVDFLLLFAYFVFIYLLQNELVVFTFIIQCFHLFSPMCLLVSMLTVKTQIRLTFLTLVIFVLCFGFDILVFFMRFVWSLVILSDVWYWVLLGTTIASIIFDAFILMTLLVVSVRYPKAETTSPLTKKQVSNTLTSRAKLSFQWKVELFLAIIMLVLFVLDLDPMLTSLPFLLYIPHLIVLMVWPWFVAISGQKQADGLHLYGATNSPTLIWCFFVFYCGTVFGPTVLVFVTRVIYLFVLTFIYPIGVFFTVISTISVVLVGVLMVFAFLNATSLQLLYDVLSASPISW